MFHFNREVSIFLLFRVLYTLYVLLIFGSYSSLGDSRNYLNGNFDNFEFSSTYLTILIGSIFNLLYFELSNILFVILSSYIIIKLLLKNFLYSERFYIYILFFFPSTGVFLSIYSKEALLSIILLVFFVCIRRNSFSWILITSLLFISFFKPVLGILLFFYWRLRALAVQFNYLRMFLLSFLFLFSAIIFLAFVFHFFMDEIDLFFQNFHIYFVDGNLSNNMIINGFNGFLELVPSFLISWFFPFYFTGFLSFTTFIFDFEGFIFILIIFYLSKSSFKFSPGSILFFFGLIIIFSMLVIMGPYSIFNAGSTLRYRSTIFEIIVFIILDVNLVRRLRSRACKSLVTDQWDEHPHP